jgi:jumonji domain-containing protein 2
VFTEGEDSEVEDHRSGLELSEIPVALSEERNDFKVPRTIEGETNTAKSWRHPLTKPLARSPMTIVKQQVASDDELPEILSTKEEVEEMESWAKTLIQLWQMKSCNFVAK